MSQVMTRRKTILVSILVAMDLLVAGAVTACPQTPDNPEPKAEAKKSGKMQPEPKPETEAKAMEDDTDTNKDTSVKLSHNFRGLGARFLLDQKEIWVSPAKLRFTDLVSPPCWAVPPECGC